MTQENSPVVLDPFYWHEAIDRTYIVIDIIQSHILDHPVFTQTESLKAKAEKAQELLSEVYQEIGNMIDSDK